MLQAMHEPFPPRPLLLLKFVLLMKPSGFKQLFSKLRVTDPHTGPPSHVVNNSPTISSGSLSPDCWPRSSGDYTQGLHSRITLTHPAWAGRAGPSSDRTFLWKRNSDYGNRSPVEGREKDAERQTIIHRPAQPKPWGPNLRSRAS